MIRATKTIYVFIGGFFEEQKFKNSAEGSLLSLMILSINYKTLQAVSVSALNKVFFGLYLALKKHGFFGGLGEGGPKCSLFCFSGRVEKKCWPRCLRKGGKGGRDS